MASIQSLGIGSGLLTSDLVEDIIGAEREATDIRLEARRAEVDARISSFAGIRSTVDQLRSATSALSGTGGLISNTTTSSDATALTATAATSAEVGVHTVEVQSLARKATLASIRFDDLESVVGDGTLDIRFGTTTLDVDGNYDTFTENTERAAVSIQIGEGSRTLTGVRDAINEAAAGVTAAIVNDGDGYVLVLTSSRAGADNSLEITVTEGATAGLSSLAFNAAASTPGTHLTQNVAAQDAVLIVDGISVRREENTINEVIPGVTLNALSVTESPVTLGINQDNDAVVERVQTFVDAFNDVKALLDQLTAFDEDAGSGALLMGDSTVRGLRTQMRRILTASVAELDNGGLRAMVDLGVSTDQNNNFALKLSTTQLTNALLSDPEGVQALVGDSSRASDEQIIVSRFQNATEAGTYDVIVHQLATNGLQAGQTVAGLAAGITIDADNDDLTVVVDGISAAVSLTQGSYADGEAIAREIQNQINAASSLQSAGVSVAVSFDTDNEQLSITSSSYGSRSKVALTAVDTNTAAELGFAVNDGEAGKGVDVAGSINGIDGSGSGQFLTLPLGPVAASSGIFRGNTTAAFDSPPLTINADNGVFSVNVDGTTSGSIALTPGSYATAQDLAAEMAAQINADANLSGLGISVAVSFNTSTSAFEITSASKGASSRVDVISTAANVSADLGLAVGSGTVGKRASTVADPASGLQIQVLGGDVGARGDVSVIRGVMSRFDRFLDDLLAFDGGLANKISSLESLKTDIDDEAADFEKRMGLLEDRLRTQFAAADALISQLNSTGSFLDSQLANLPGYSSNKS